MNSCNTDIFFSNYYHLQSVRFELTFFVDFFFVSSVEESDIPLLLSVASTHTPHNVSLGS